MFDYEGFKKEVLKLTSIDLGYYKEKQMKRRIGSLINKNGFNDYSAYLKAITQNKNLLDEFINFITINVSEFYRNPDQWKILECEILPTLLKKKQRLKIWSAACSAGEEPYTAVMVLNKYLSLNEINILATDIDVEVLKKAKAGRYNSKSVENLPNSFLRKHFTIENNMYVINEDIKKCVEFRRHDLLKDDYPLQCDLIICRNVLIYFTEEAKSEIYNKFRKSLKDSGILFVGSTEQIIMPGRYNLRSVKTFFYTKEA